MKTYTDEEVVNILVSVQLFSGANRNQGLKNVKGENYGERARTIINANNSSKSITEAVKKFR